MEETVIADKAKLDELCVEAERLFAENHRLRAQLGAAKRLIEVVRAREIGTAGGVGAAFEAYDALGNAKDG